MTVSYTSKVSKSGLGSFVRILFIWKGSIYKLVYKELFIFVGLYYTIQLFYRFVMNDYQRATFEQIVLYCDTFVNLIPLPFVLGFFVSIIVGRWWSQFQAIPFPDELMIFVNSLLLGKDDKSRLIRRTLMRYLNLTSLLIFRSISSPVKKRFPDMESLVEAGFMTFKELKIYENMATPHSKWWVPCVWFSNIITRAHNEKRLVDEFSLRTILLALMDFRGKCSALYCFDWISVPLVYTQVVTLANYMYFMANLMGRQILDPNKRYSNRFDIYFPIFTFLHFLFYMGWLKVAEQLMNPFGEDEDDFEINWIIDRNFQISMLAVDDLHDTFPDFEKDIYWDEFEPEIPYTEASKYYKKNSWMGSTADLHLRREDVNDIHKDWISTENIKSLNPFSNLHDTIHRLSSSSCSRKSSHSIKSDSREHKPVKAPIDDEDYFGSINNAPTYRSSFSHVPRFGSHSLLTPIREQRFEVTRISDDSVVDSSKSNGALPKNKSSPVNDQNNNSLNPDSERRKKISASDNNSTINENDLTIKGNIGNLAKFHNRKIREKMLKSAASYVSEDFGNADTPYAKRPLSQSKSCPKEVLLTCNQGLEVADLSRVQGGKRFWNLEVGGPNAFFKRKRINVKEKSPGTKIQGMSPKRGIYGGSSRRHRRLTYHLNSQASQTMTSSYFPIKGDTHLWAHNRSFKRASISSEIKSWIIPAARPSQISSNLDKACLVENELCFVNRNADDKFNFAPNRDDSNLIAHPIQQISPKMGAIRKCLSQPHEGNLTEEDESDLTTNGQLSNEVTLLKCGDTVSDGNVRGNVIDMFSKDQSLAKRKIAVVRMGSPIKENEINNNQLKSPMHNKANEILKKETPNRSINTNSKQAACNFIEITLV